jgi:hypothetical protein
MIEQYRFALSEFEDWQWSSAWLPLTRASWAASAIELVDHRDAFVLDVSFPDLPRMASPSLPALLTVAADLAEVDLIEYERKPFPGWTAEEARLREKAFESSKRSFITDAFVRHGWEGAPFPPGEEIRPDLWIDEWGGPILPWP